MKNQNRGGLLVLGIEGEQMPDRSRGRIRLVVLKNRTWSSLGETDILMMNEQTGILEDASETYEGI